MTGRAWVQRIGAFAVAALVLTGCEGGFGPFGGGTSGEDKPEAEPRTTRLVERDEEAPGVFQVSEPGLWDGRPSLGGVWVAHPDVREPERVIIRNPGSDKFVIGALFRRERDVPGPRLQISSDAASALGMIAGQPTEISVTALRRVEVEEPDPAAAPAPAEEPAPEIATAELGPLASAAAAIASADARAAEGGAAASAAASPPAATPAPARTASSVPKAYVQVGIFSQEANARRARDMLAARSISAEITRQTLRNTPYWRVLAGPAESAAARDALVKAVRETGFADAFATNR